MKILAIETSCDETACAIVEDGTKMLSNVVASSAAVHAKYGGVVPEIAAREQLKCIIPVITEALEPVMKQLSMSNYQLAITKEVDAIAVTIGPGLLGSLLVGVETAKTVAFVTGKPIIPVNHVIAHMYVNFVDYEPRTKNREQKPLKQFNNLTIQQYTHSTIEFPAISLVVSGGHTELYLMESVTKLRWLGGTLDDAAGEAFDKTARLLGFENRGGPAIQEAAAKWQQSTMNKQQVTIKLPRPMIGDESLNFSFSGLKTAVVREWKKHQEAFHKAKQKIVSAFAYEIQEAITDVLVVKTLRATERYGARSILLSGGVASNTRLREKLTGAMKQYNPKVRLPRSVPLSGSTPEERDFGAGNVTMYAPPAALCTDNAVSIGACAFFRGKPADWHAITAEPNMRVEM